MTETDMVPDRPTRTVGTDGRDRTVLLTLVGMQFTSLDDVMLITALGPQLIRSLHIGPAQLGLVVSSYTLSASVAGLIAFTLVDRFSRKTAFLTLYAGFQVGTFLCGMAPSYAALLASLVISGAFGGVLGGMTLAIIGDIFPEDRRGAATGTLWMAYAISAVFGVPSGKYLATRLGWHAPFLLLAGLGCPLLAAAMRFLPPLRGHLGQATAARPLAEVRAPYTHPNHIRAFALVVALWFSSSSVIPFILPYLIANVGVGETRLPLVYIVGGA